MKWSLEALFRAGLLDRFGLQGTPHPNGLRLVPTDHRLAPFVELNLIARGDQIQEACLRCHPAWAAAGAELEQWLAEQLSPQVSREDGLTTLRPAGGRLRFL